MYLLYCTDSTPHTTPPKNPSTPHCGVDSTYFTLHHTHTALHLHIPTLTPHPTPHTWTFHMTCSTIRIAQSTLYATHYTLPSRFRNGAHPIYRHAPSTCATERSHAHVSGSSSEAQETRCCRRQCQRRRHGCVERQHRQKSNGRRQVDQAGARAHPAEAPPRPKQHAPKNQLCVDGRVGDHNVFVRGDQRHFLGWRFSAGPFVIRRRGYKGLVLLCSPCVDAGHDRQLNDREGHHDGPSHDKHQRRIPMTQVKECRHVLGLKHPADPKSKAGGYATDQFQRKRQALPDAGAAGLRGHGQSKEADGHGRQALQAELQRLLGIGRARRGAEVLRQGHC
mmetsp:Transcript_42578/g.69078  ORF Transcript_42578/g.69078 Transcript_42578/m.69078 type:complete len:336 (-) Transcript_42578:438-1445(-)